MAESSNSAAEGGFQGQFFVKGSLGDNRSWTEYFVATKDKSIEFFVTRSDPPKFMLKLSDFTTVASAADDGSHKHNLILTNVDDTTSEQWTISCQTKENLDKLESLVKPNLRAPVVKSGKRKTVKTQPIEDDNVPEIVKKLRSHFRAKADTFEKLRIASHMGLEKRITERITSFKKKMIEDLRQYGEDDVLIVNLMTKNFSEIILLLTDHLNNRTQHFTELKNQKVKSAEDMLAKLSRLATTLPVPPVAEFTKVVSDSATEYQQQMSNDVATLIERYDKAGKLQEAELSIHITDLEKTKQKDKSPFYIEQYQLMMGVLKFLRTDTMQLLEDELAVIAADGKNDVAFLQENFK